MAKKIDYAALYTRRKDGRYMGYYRDYAGKRHATYDKDPEALYKKLRELEAATAVPPVMTVKQVEEEWERQHREEIGIRTWKNYAPHIAELLEEHGDKPITELSALDIQRDLMQAKSKGYSATIVQTRRSLYRMICDFAIIHGYRLDNPCAAVKLPKGLPRGKREAPTDEEIKTIMQSGAAPFGLFPILLLCTGLRKSEALALDWEDVDWKNNEISITKSLDYPSGSRPVVKSPKTDAGIRTVPLLSVLRPLLEEAYAKRSGPHIFPAPPSNRAGEGGGYMTLRGFEGAWKRWQDATGIELTAHQLRHGTATLMFEADVDELTAQKILGHSRIEITREIYTELRQKQKNQSVQRLNDKLTTMLA